MCEFRRPCLAPSAAGEDWRCGIDHPTEGQRLWEITQQQRPIWEASDALFPQIYLESPGRDAGLGGKSAGFDRAGLRSVVRQAVRGAELVGARPVLPFAATFCDLPFKCYSNGSLTLEPWAVEMVLTMPYQEGAAGV